MSNFNINFTLNLNTSKPETATMEFANSSVSLCDEFEEPKVDDTFDTATSLGAQLNAGMYPGPGFTGYLTPVNDFTSQIGAMSCCVFPSALDGTPAVFNFWSLKTNAEDNDISWSYSSSLGVNTWAAQQTIPVGAPEGGRQRMLTSAALKYDNTLYLFYTTPQQDGPSNTQSYIRYVTFTGGVWAPFAYVQDSAGVKAVAVRNSFLSAFFVEPSIAEPTKQLVLFYRNYNTTAITTSSPSGLVYLMYNTTTGFGAPLPIVTNPPLYSTCSLTTRTVAGTGRFSAVPFNDSRAMIVYQGTDNKLAYCVLEKNGTITAGDTLDDNSWSYLSATTVRKLAPYSDSVYFFNNRSDAEGLSSRFITKAVGSSTIVTKPDTVIEPMYCSTYSASLTSGPVSKAWVCSCVFNGSVVCFYIFNNNGCRLHYVVGFSAP